MCEPSQWVNMEAALGVGAGHAPRRTLPSELGPWTDVHRNYERDKETAITLHSNIRAQLGCHLRPKPRLFKGCRVGEIHAQRKTPAGGTICKLWELWPQPQEWRPTRLPLSPERRLKCSLKLDSFGNSETSELSLLTPTHSAHALNSLYTITGDAQIQCCPSKGLSWKTQDLE